MPLCCRGGRLFPNDGFWNTVPDRRLLLCFAEQHSIGTELPIPADNLQWMNELLVKVGNITKPLDMTKVIDRKPREDALKLVAQTQ
jgi:hypothetical protein